MPHQIPAGPISGQVIYPPSGAEYALVSLGMPMRAPYVLECAGLRTGAVVPGSTFPVGSIAAAAGYLWVYGAPSPGAQPVADQVSPVTLARIRSIRLPRGHIGSGLAHFAAGSGHSVWIGSYRTVLRLDVATGARLARLTLPRGLVVSDISMDPAHRALYVSAAHGAGDGNISGLTLLEYATQLGRLRAAASGGLLRYSVAGAWITAVPGGVWVSFRTGLLGLTIHLGRDGLPMIAPPGPGVALRPAKGLFHWPMFAATSFGGGALWLVSQTNLACLDPRTGRVRASERVTQMPGRMISQSLVTDPAHQVIYGWGPGGLLQLTPPRRCWG